MPEPPLQRPGAWSTGSLGPGLRLFGGGGGGSAGPNVGAIHSEKATRPDPMRDAHLKHVGTGPGNQIRSGEAKFGSAGTRRNTDNADRTTLATGDRSDRARASPRTERHDPEAGTRSEP